MRAQVDPRGAHDHHSERLHEEDDPGHRPSGRARGRRDPHHRRRRCGLVRLTNCPQPPSSPPWPACWEPRLRSLRAAKRTRERSDRAVCLGAARRTGGELAMTRARVVEGQLPGGVCGLHVGGRVRAAPGRQGRREGPGQGPRLRAATPGDTHGTANVPATLSSCLTTADSAGGSCRP